MTDATGAEAALHERTCAPRPNRGDTPNHSQPAPNHGRHVVVNGQRSFSLTDFVKGESILVLGRDPKYAGRLDPINTLILTQLAAPLPERLPDECIYLVIDELTVALVGG